MKIVRRELKENIALYKLAKWGVGKMLQKRAKKKETPKDPHMEALEKIRAEQAARRATQVPRHEQTPEEAGRSVVPGMSRGRSVRAGDRGIISVTPKKVKPLLRGRGSSVIRGKTPGI